VCGDGTECGGEWVQPEKRGEPGGCERDPVREADG